MSMLKAEFGHHAEKLDEYEQMRKEIDRLEGTPHQHARDCYYCYSWRM